MDAQAARAPERQVDDDDDEPGADGAPMLAVLEGGVA